MADQFTFEIVDQIAHAYGWSVKYIQRLDMGEINGLLEAITERKKNEALILRHILMSILGVKSDSKIPVEDDSDALNTLIKKGIARVEQKGKK